MRELSSYFTCISLDTLMESVDSTLKEITRDALSQFHSAMREIRRGKAALLQAEYRLHLAEENFKKAMASIREDVNIIVALGSDEDFQSEGRDAGTEEEEEAPPSTSTHEKKHGNIDDSGVEDPFENGDIKVLY